jgi:hypothetical protein
MRKSGLRSIYRTALLPPIPRPERFLMVPALWPARSAFRADALELFPTSRLALS